MNTPAITFIIPAFNAASTIGATLRSLLGQTSGRWAAIVVDDGSTDRTARIAAGMADPRIEVRRQVNAGVAAARNRGLGRAKSDAVCFLDADDSVDPAFIERMLPALAGYNLAASAYRYTDPELRDAGWIVNPSPGDERPERLAEFNQFAIGAIVFDRASLIRMAGSAPFPVDTRQEDWALLLHLSRHGARWAPFVDEPLYSYRLRPDSRTTALCPIWRDGLNLIARLHPDPPSVGPALRRWTLRNLARAATLGDQRLCAQLFEHLDALTALDADTLCGALRWSMRRAALAREPLALIPPGLWHARILDALGHSDLTRDVLTRACRPDWDRVAAAAAARLGPDQTLVIYGLGRNGRDVLTALGSCGIPLAVIDDEAPSPPDVRRLTVPDLSPNHIVLVTPDDRAAILASLGRGRQGQVLLPEQLVA